MRLKLLTSSLLAAAIFTGGVVAPIHAGHATDAAADARMDAFMAHHGFAAAGPVGSHRAVLGVAVAEIPQSELDGMQIEYGVRIVKVMPGSVADAAGLKAGDVLTAIDDRPAYSAERLRHLVAGTAGETGLSVSRDGKSVKLAAAFPIPEQARAMLGVRIQEMTGELKEAFGAQGDTGVLVSQVLAGSPAKQAGLRAGDVIVAVGDREITSARGLTDLLADYAPGDKLDVAFVREREKKSLQIELASLSPRVGAAHPQPYGKYGAWKHGNHGYGFHHHYGMKPHYGCPSRKSQVHS